MICAPRGMVIFELGPTARMRPSCIRTELFSMTGSTGDGYIFAPVRARSEARFETVVMKIKPRTPTKRRIDENIRQRPVNREPGLAGRRLARTTTEWICECRARSREGESPPLIVSDIAHYWGHKRQRRRHSAAGVSPSHYGHDADFREPIPVTSVCQDVSSPRHLRVPNFLQAD